MRDCLAAREACRDYESDRKHVDRRRIGNFWFDLLAFRRTTDVTGWHFNALVVLKNDLVIYKLWSGQPAIKELEENRNPLGPFQGAGDRLVPHKGT